jgi:TonB-dependent receptor
MIRILVSRLVLLLAACALLARPASAQPASSLSGRIYDGATQSVLRGAAVTLTPATAGGSTLRTVTDANGEFTLTAPAGNYTLALDYLGLPPKSQAITLGAAPVRLTLTLGDTAVTLAAVTVEATRTGQARALNQQRASQNLTNIVSADFSGQFPDKTVADAVKRLPGITVETDRDTGGVEGRYITVRGMSADFNAVTIDGVRVNVTDFDGITRRVPLDVVSSDVADQIEVTKALRPDQEADSIGGAVNIRTRSAFSRGSRSASVRAALSFSDQLEDYSGKFPHDNPGYEGAVTYSDLFGAEQQFGFSLAANIRDRTFVKSRHSTTGWNSVTGIRPGTAGTFTNLPGGPAWIMDSFVLQDFVDAFRTDGLNGSFEWRPRADTRLRLFASTNARTTERGRQRQQIFYPSTTAANISGVIGTPAVTADTVTDYSGLNSTVRREVRAFDEEQKTSIIALDGQTHLGDTQLDFVAGYNWAKWDGGLGTALQARFDQRFTNSYRITPGDAASRPTVSAVTPAGVDYNDARTFSGYTLSQLNRGSRAYDDDEFNFGLDAQHDLKLADWTGFIKAGVKFRTRTRELDHTEGIYGANAGWNLSGYTGAYTGSATVNRSLIADYRVKDTNGYNYGVFLDPKAVREVGDALIADGRMVRNTFADGTTLNSFFSRVDDYKATEAVYATYVMGQFTRGKLTLLPGVRFEATKTEFDTFLVQGSTASNQPLPGTVRIKPTRDADNFFPGLHARYDFPRDLVLRASFTESLSRPTFSQLNPRENRNISDDAVDNDSISRGRLDLKPTTAKNYDVSIERYLGRLGYVSAGVFYKDYKNNVYRFVQTELVNNIPTRVTEPRNARGGKLLGLELAADYQLAFLPAPFDSLGVTANYTKTDSELDSGIPAASGRKIPLFDQVEDTVNLSVYYSKGRLRARAALNYRSETLFSYDTTRPPELGRTEAPSTTIDLSASYKFYREWTVFGEMNNVFDEPSFAYNGNRNLRLDNKEYSGWTAIIGVRWSL